MEDYRFSAGPSVNQILVGRSPKRQDVNLLKPVDN